MPQTRKRKLIEEKLGESLESFLTKRFSARQAVRSIAREIGADPATVRYYRDKYGIPSKLYWKKKLRSGPAIYKKKTRKVLNTRLRGKHVDICLCPLCSVNCRERKKSHKLGRCVIICNNFRGRLRNG